MNADLEWLKSRWKLPESAVPAVRDLLEAESNGSTACVLEKPVPDWGKAAGAPGSNAPIVLVEADGRTFLQSRAAHLAEQSIAKRLLELANAEPVSCNNLQATLGALFPGAGKDDRQAEAARLAATRSLAIVTGGPGTGKTYSLARALVLLLVGGTDPRTIRLAAPTGKAAQRMKSAVEQAAAALPGAFAAHTPALGQVAATSSTVHSLLGYSPERGTCRPLPPRTTVILDEASMVDLDMWRALLHNLPRDGRLILLGDPNQLESVGRGSVLATLATTPALAKNRVHLTEARRFKDRPAIQKLAEAIAACDGKAAASIFRNSPGEGVTWVPGGPRGLPVSDFPGEILARLEAIARAENPEAALNATTRVCVLTAQREFFVGAKAVSTQIAAALAARGPVRFHPIIINRNDPETGLRNGQVGVVGDTPDGRTAWFHDGSTGLREFRLAALPEHAPAWALTIHRSQGSEYDDVMVVLPRSSSPLATRELLYTAITRARRSVFVVGDPATVESAASRPSGRTSLLAWQFQHQNSSQKSQTQKIG